MEEAVDLARRSRHPWVAADQNKVRCGMFGWFLNWPEDLEFVSLIEDLGFDSFLTYDHPMRSMDCWLNLTALAIATKKIRLISFVNCIYYRHPALVARLAADVDRLSHGRLILGLGIGDDVDEFEQLNIPFPPSKERQEALEDAIKIIVGLWETERFSYHGPHFQVTEASLALRPDRQPHIPLLIGGGGERVTLRQVAQYADVSNIGAHDWIGGAYDAADVRRKYAALRGHCEALGRPYDSILRTYYIPMIVLAETPAELQAKTADYRPHPREKFAPLFATPRDAVAHMQGLVDAGVQYFLVATRGRDRETVRLLAEQVLPELESHPA